MTSGPTCSSTAATTAAYRWVNVAQPRPYRPGSDVSTRTTTSGMPSGAVTSARTAVTRTCVVIGSGLAGLTAANTLARSGQSVLLLEQHYKLGGMATWFKRPGGHIFDISLHGFPIGMIKSCRRYWSKEIADSIVQLKNIRFDNPMFQL